jgi:SAM-dependent methyltransferase
MIIGYLERDEVDLAGKTFLEIGPGQDLGMPLLLIGLGARATIVDEYPSGWNASFHGTYYDALLDAAPGAFPGIDAKPIEQVIAVGAHEADGLEVHGVGLEDIDAIPDGTIDISYSNATMEHLRNASRAIEQLSRVTRAGGVGFHQIDLRDHRDFDRPLEYLTLTEDALNELMDERDYSCGNALRYTDFEQLFEQHGFDTRFDANGFAEPEYLADVTPRLHERFRALPAEAFRVLGGRFFLTKRG